MHKYANLTFIKYFHLCWQWFFHKPKTTWEKNPYKRRLFSIVDKGFPRDSHNKQQTAASLVCSDRWKISCWGSHACKKQDPETSELQQTRRIPLWRLFLIVPEGNMQTSKKRRHPKVLPNEVIVSMAWQFYGSNHIPWGN